ncbi:unnamed protein product, partial [Symbiodinium microadriaticum]
PRPHSLAHAWCAGDGEPHDECRTSRPGHRGDLRRSAAPEGETRAVSAACCAESGAPPLHRLRAVAQALAWEPCGDASRVSRLDALRSQRGHLG